MLLHSAFICMGATSGLAGGCGTWCGAIWYCWSAGMVLLGAGGRGLEVAGEGEGLGGPPPLELAGAGGTKEVGSWPPCACSIACIACICACICCICMW
jgi:hypothetical protein